MDTTSAVGRVLSRLQSLIRESLAARGDAPANDGQPSLDIDEKDVQTRAMSTLAALDVLVPDFEELALSGILQKRINDMSVDFVAAATEVATHATRGQYDAVETQLLALLRSPAFLAVKSSVSSEIQEVVAGLMQQSEKLEAPITSILPKDVVTPSNGGSPSAQAPVSSATLDELMFLTTGPSLAEIDPLLIGVASDHVPTKREALDALIQYTPSDILHSQYFVPTKDALVASLSCGDEMAEIQALRYVGKLYSEAIDVSPVQASEMCCDLTRVLIQTRIPNYCPPFSASHRVLVMKYRLLHDMIRTLQSSWVYVPEPEVDRLFLSVFSLLHLDFTSRMTHPTSMTPFDLLSLVCEAASPSNHWFAAWCLLARPRSQMFQCMSKLGFLRDLVEIVHGSVKAPTATVRHATTMLCCMLAFAEGQAVFPVIVPHARFQRSEETRDQILAMVDSGCTPDSATNNRIRHIAAPLPSQLASIPGAILSVAQVIGSIVSCVLTTGSTCVDVKLILPAIEACVKTGCLTSSDLSTMANSCASWLLRHTKSSGFSEATNASDICLGIVRVFVATLSDWVTHRSATVQLLLSCLDSLSLLSSTALLFVTECISSWKHPKTMSSLLVSHPEVPEAVVKAISSCSIDGTANAVVEALIPVAVSPLGFGWLHDCGLICRCAELLGSIVLQQPHRYPLLRVYSQCSSGCEGLLSRGLLPSLLSSLTLLLESPDLPYDLHCPDSEAHCIGRTLLPLEALLRSEYFIRSMTVATPDTHSHLYKLGQFLRAGISGERKFPVPCEAVLVSQRLLLAACSTPMSCVLLDDAWGIMTVIEDLLAQPVSDAGTIDSDSLPEGVDFVKTAPITGELDSLASRTAESFPVVPITAENIQRTQLLSHAVIEAPVLEESVYLDGAATISRNRTEVAACPQFQLAVPDTTAYEVSMLSSESLWEVLRRTGSSRCCLPLYSDWLGRLTRTTASVGKPRSVSAAFETFVSTYREVLTQKYGLVPSAPVDCDVEFWSATASLLSPSVTMIAFKGLVQDLLQATDKRKQAIGHLWSSSALSTAAFLSNPTLSRLCHAIDEIVDAEFPLLFSALQASGSTPSQIVQDWLRSCFWNVLSFPDVVSVGFVVPWFEGLQGFVGVVAAMFASQQEHVIACAAESLPLRKALRFVDSGLDWMAITTAAQTIVSKHATILTPLL